MIEDPRPSDQGGLRLRIAHSPELSERLQIGASLSVSGVCLTLIEHQHGRSTVELSPETLARSTLGNLRRGSEVNLEPALRFGDPVGGHWVQGHVDTITEVRSRQDLEEHRVLGFSLPHSLDAAVVEKGSVAIDGVSLTVASRDAASFEVALIPHTLEVTTLGNLAPGDRANIEADILAKYVQQALAARALPGE